MSETVFICQIKNVHINDSLCMSQTVCSILFVIYCICTDIGLEMFTCSANWGPHVRIASYTSHVQQQPTVVLYKLFLIM